MIENHLTSTDGASPFSGTSLSKSESAIRVPSVADLPAIGDLLRATMPPAEAHRALDRIRLILDRTDSIPMAVFASESNERVLAVGFVVQSMHAFGHSGLDLTAIARGHEDSAEVKELVAKLLSGGAAQFKESEIHKIDDFQSQVLNTRSFVAFSTGTRYPEILSTFGFQTVHTHMDRHGEPVSWMMFVPGREMQFVQHGMSKPRVTPEFHSSVQLIDNQPRLAETKKLVAKEWGDAGGENFCAEYAMLQSMPGSGMYSVMEGDKVIGVGAIIKALHHDEAWSRAWIIVDPDQRGRGVAERLIRGLLQHADNWHRAHDLGVMVMEGFSFVPEYYERFGNVMVARANQQTLDHKYPTWTMRITDPSAPLG